MEKEINSLFGDCLFTNIYFTESNPAKVETIEIKKIGDEIKEEKKTQIFNLLTYSVGRSGSASMNIRENVKAAFIARLNYSSVNSEAKYFDRGFFKNLFSKRRPESLAAYFDGKHDWAITSPEIASELSSLERFEPMQGHSDIRLIGKIGKTLIFKIERLESSIYMGSKESVTAVFNRNLSEDKYGTVIQYCIQANERIEKIIVH